MTMIERVAREICKAEGYTHPDEDWRSTRNGVALPITAEVHIPDGETQRWRTYTRHARAAIEAMREPTKHMTDDGWYSAHDEDAAGCWRDMIAAALKE